jgi:hypothetical protein
LFARAREVSARADDARHARRFNRGGACAPDHFAAVHSVEPWARWYVPIA